MTVTLVACVAAAVGVDESGRWLAGIVAEALKRADVTQDFVSRCTEIPRPRLSDQLAGKLPFTGLCRILANQQIRRETDFWEELTALFADQVDRALVPRDLGTLVSRVTLIGERLDALFVAPPKRREIKAAHAADSQRVHLPLTKAGIR